MTAGRTHREPPHGPGITAPGRARDAVLARIEGGEPFARIGPKLAGLYGNVNMAASKTTPELRVDIDRTADVATAWIGVAQSANRGAIHRVPAIPGSENRHGV